MMKTLLAILAGVFSLTGWMRGDVLIVADEIPAMEVLAKKLKDAESIPSRIVTQTNLPKALAPFSAVVVYIHKGLAAAAEQAFIDYAQGGGKLIVLHHSISSGKRTNKQWFSFLGVDLPAGDVAAGGYQWIEPVTLDFVNLAPDHYLTGHRVKYEKPIAYTRSDGGAGVTELPGFTLKDSEVYLNHVLTGPRTILLGLKYADAKSGKTYQQECAGWCRPAGKGWIVYLMPGHSAAEFENPTYARILVNAVTWKP
jgi:hypothetical protein